jgi:hypothetical protein
MWASLIPAALGIIGSLFKKKSDKNKTQYSTMMSPQQQQYYTYLLGMLKNMNQQGSQGLATQNNALNTLYGSKLFK